MRFCEIFFMKFLNSVRNGTSRLAMALSTASFFLGATPSHVGMASSPSETVEDTVMVCLFQEVYDPGRKYTSEDIDGITHRTFICTKNKPESLTERYFREIIRAESNDDPGIIGYEIEQDSTGKFIYKMDEYNRRIPSGAKGLGQIKEIAWREGSKRLNYLSTYDKDVFNPWVNSDITMAHLLFQYDYARLHHPNFDSLTHSEQRQIIAAGNNWGPSRLARNLYRLDKTPPETRAYVAKIKARLGDE